MDGSRGRIGVIYPSDGVLDGEFWRCVPPGVSVHVTRSLSSMDLDPDLGVSERHVLMAESTDIDDAAKRFSLIGVGCVAYACTAAAFGRGVGYDTEIVRRIEAALRHMSVERVAVAAPYEDVTCERLRQFLEDSEFEVVNLENLGLSGTAIGAVSSDQVYALCRRAMTPDADGLFISCTGFPAIELIEALEQDLGVPVVNSNQATMWYALRIAGIQASMEGLGRLYRM